MGLKVLGKLGCIYISVDTTCELPDVKASTLDPLTWRH